MSRRALLAGATAAAAISVAGCGSSRGSKTLDVGGAGSRWGPNPGARTGSDRDIAVAALADENSALALYTALATRNRPLRQPLHDLMRIQREHVAALSAAIDGGTPASAHPPRAGRAVTAVPATAKRLAASRLADCETVESGAFASLLASMAASHRSVAAQWHSR
jgi:hypothetical protein